MFNVAQVDGVPAALQAVERHTWEPEARAEELLAHVRCHHPPRRRARRTTSPATTRSTCRHSVRSPTLAGYYATALHELTHWTAPPSRCNRQLGQRFGDDAYAAEELIAEMGAAFLCAHCRIDGELHHAGYLSSWLKVLRQDKRAIFVAATRAQQAADYLLRQLQPPDQGVAAQAA